MLGMNAEALNFCVGSFVNFVERIGAMCAGMASMVTPRPDFPPGHPMHGTMVVCISVLASLVKALTSNRFFIVGRMNRSTSNRRRREESEAASAHFPVPIQHGRAHDHVQAPALAGRIQKQGAKSAERATNASDEPEPGANFPEYRWRAKPSASSIKSKCIAKSLMLCFVCVVAN